MNDYRTEKTEIPEWMCQQEEYTPSKDKEAFLTKSTKSVLSVLGKLRFHEGKDGRFSATPSLKLFYTLIYIILKYISVLGEICVDILTSVGLRSVGKNPDKAKSFSGVLGITFLKSSEMAEEMYASMCCRGFTGEYQMSKKYRLCLQDVLGILMMVCGICLFLYLNVNM